MLIASPLNPREVIRAVKRNIVFVSRVNNFGGRANKFCIGRRDTVFKISSRLARTDAELASLLKGWSWDEAIARLTRNGEVKRYKAETNFKHALTSSGAKIRTSRLFWAKVRAGGRVKPHQWRKIPARRRRRTMRAFPQVWVRRPRIRARRRPRR